MPPRFLYFDFGEVLFRFSHPLAARQMAQVAGTDFHTVWNTVFAGDLELRFEAGDLTNDQFHEEFCRRTGTRPDRDALLEAGSAIFTPNLPMKAITAAVQAAGHRTGILSNTCDPHWQWCTGGRFGDFPAGFEITALSYQLGSVKPDPDIYLRAIELTGLAASEIFFVDDRPENVAGATAAGMDAVLYTTPAILAADLRRRGIGFNY
jgi:putative hydrolase of the HAD superfamily